MAGGAEEDVFGLHVPVDDAARVCGLETLGNGRCDLRSLVPGNRSAPQGAPERLPFEKLREGVVDSVRLADVEQREDVGVRERSDGLRLALESCESSLVAREMVGEDLDRDVSPEPGVASPVDSPMPPAPSGERIS